MKKFGLIGGTSWYSTTEYYAYINKSINDKYGDNTNPPLYISSLNQKIIHDYQRSDNWDAIAKIYIEKVAELEKIGLEGIAFCANTPHKTYDIVEKNTNIPILHIADAIAAKVKQKNVSTIGFLGTTFSMQENFIKQRLLEKHNIKTIVPEVELQLKMQDYFYNQICVGVFSDPIKQFFESIIDVLVEQGAEAAVLGCTEFPILLKDTKRDIPLIDSLRSHCDSIIDFILEN